MSGPYAQSGRWLVGVIGRSASSHARRNHLDQSFYVHFAGQAVRGEIVIHRFGSKTVWSYFATATFLQFFVVIEHVEGCPQARSGVAIVDDAESLILCASRVGIGIVGGEIDALSPTF